MNGTNGHNVDPQEWPGPGLWLLIVDGGVAYLAMTTEPASESEIAKELEMTGSARLSLQPIYVLDSIRGAMPDQNRNVRPICIPTAQRLDQRIGLSDDFPVHMTVRAVAFLSTLPVVVRTQLRAIIDNIEDALLKQRAERAGISLPTSHG